MESQSPSLKTRQDTRSSPKNWDCDVKLFEESERPYTELEQKAVDSFNRKEPESIKAAIEAGALVTVKSVFYGWAEADVDRNKGWRIITKLPQYGSPRNGASISPYKLYRDYEGAEEEANAIRREFEWQKNLSEEDWSKYQINEKLGFYKYLHSKTENEINKIRNWLFSLDKIEDVEVRTFGGHLEWKYWKNKKWNAIEEDAL